MYMDTYKKLTQKDERRQKWYLNTHKALFIIRKWDVNVEKQNKDNTEEQIERIPDRLKGKGNAK